MNDGNSSSAAALRLPVWHTALEAWRIVLRQPGPLLKAFAAPLFLFIVLWILVPRAPWFIDVDPASADNPINPLRAIALWIPFTIFAVSWHRFILLGPIQGALRWKPSWKAHHWRFLAYFALIQLVFFGYGIELFDPVWLLTTYVPSTYFPMVILVLIPLHILALYLSVRVSFAFPATALNLSYGFRFSWRDTRGHGLRLLATFCLVIIPIIAFHGAMALRDEPPYDCEPILSESSPNADTSGDGYHSNNCDNAVTPAYQYVLAVILLVIAFMTEAAAVSLASIAFRTCTGWVPASSGGPPATGGDSSAG